MTHKKPSPAVVEPYRSRHLIIEPDVRGSSRYQKLSYPVKYGRFSRITTPEAILEFNRNYEIRHVQSRDPRWKHPQEWLKRTMGNDWVYYSTGGYAGVFEALGEYYLPNLTYTTNSLLGGRPFEEPAIHHMVTQWYTILERLSVDHLPDPFQLLVKKKRANTPEQLKEKADQLFDCLGGRISVMPPDARHVDYNIIPLPICEGCLYKCKFCKVKNKHPFHVHSQARIEKTIDKIKTLYHRDLLNYNALFLGDHDALHAPADVIFSAARSAFDEFGFRTSYMKDCFLFLFGSVDSLLSKKEDFFAELNRLPYFTYINIGLESCDPATLEYLGKPITVKDVKRAFDKIQSINSVYSRIEATCNFVMDNSLSDAHYEALMELIRHNIPRPVPKGTVYLSPLAFGQPSRQVLYDFYRLKVKSRFPTFLYTIQRL